MPHLVGTSPVARWGPARRRVAGAAVALAVGALTGTTAFAHFAFATTTTVDCSTQNLQTAINSATAGDTLVISGTCSNAPSSGAAFVVAKNLTLESAAGSTATIEPSTTGRVLLVEGATTVTVSNLMITNGGGSLPGAGIYNAGTLALTDSTVTGNSVAATVANGGGVENVGTLYVSSSTISDNVTTPTSVFGSANGAGIYDTGTLSLSNATVTGNDNDAFPGQTTADEGAGLYVSASAGKVTVTNTTMTANASYNGIGGIADAGGNVNPLEGSIIYNNTNTATSKEQDCGGPRSGGYNVLGSSCLLTLTNSTDVVGQDPTLGTLGGHGGPTQTMVPAAGSPAIELIPSTTCTTCLGASPTDQRGVIRPQGTNCDAGAVEVAANPIANNDSYTATKNVALSVPAPGVLSNDTTTTGGTLTTSEVTSPTNGTLTLNSNGAFTYTPNAGFTGIDSFTYHDTDPLTAQQSATAIVTLNVQTTFQDSNPSLAYDSWHGVIDATANGGTYEVSGSKGARATVKFTGSGVTWVTRKASDQGIASVTIDRLSHGTFDLYSSTTQAQVSEAFSGLSSTTHTFVIKVTGTKNPSSNGTKVSIDAFIVGTTTIQDSSPKVEYDTWAGSTSKSASGGTYRSSGKAGATASLTFVGTSVTWVTATGPADGEAQVYIDNVAQGPVIDLYSSATQWQVAHTISGLSSGTHTIEVKVLGLKDSSSTGTKVIVDAFAVS